MHVIFFKKAIYHNSPLRACQCDLEGTDPSNTQCNEKGECSCKRNVIGAKCKKCRTGYFGLESSNPHGCRQCFCYGHTNVCDKAEGYAGRNISNDFTRGLNGWTVINEQGTQIWELIAIMTGELAEYYSSSQIQFIVPAKTTSI